MAAVLVFDGECGFCRAWLARLRRVLRTWPEQVPYQSADLGALGLTRERCESELVLVLDGRDHGGADAFAELLLMQSGWGWRLLGSTITLPGIRSLAGLVYRWVARHRRLLSGGRSACSL